MEIKQLLTAVTVVGAGNAVAIDTDKLVNGAIPILIYGGIGAIAAEIEIQGTIATNAEVAAGTCNWEVIEGGIFREEIATALIAPFSHIRANITSYTNGTISIRTGISRGLIFVGPA